MNLVIFIVSFLLPFLLPVFSTKDWDTYPESREPYCPQVLPAATEKQEVIDVVADHRNLEEIKVSPDGKYIGELYSWRLEKGVNDYDFFVYNVSTTETKKVFSIDYRFMAWQWLPDNRIKLQVDCGTNCLAYTVTNFDFKDFRNNKGAGWWTESPGYEPPSI